MAFRKIAYSHFMQRSDGGITPVVATWDLHDNAGTIMPPDSNPGGTS